VNYATGLVLLIIKSIFSVPSYVVMTWFIPRLHLARDFFC